MNKLNRCVVVVAAVVLAACNGPQNGTQQSAVTPVTCPAGQVPFNFSKFTSPMTSEGLSSLAPDATLPTLKRMPNVVTITKATCNRDFDWKAILGEFCDGRESCVINRKDCPGNLQFSYSCSAAPSEVKSYICNGTYDCVGSLSCPQSAPLFPQLYPEDKVACVPEKCSIRQRRDKDLNCVDAPERPVELSNRIEDRNPNSSADDTFVDNSVYIDEMRSPYPAVGVREGRSPSFQGAVADFDFSNIWPFEPGWSDPAAFPYFRNLTNDVAGNYRLLFAGSFYRMKGAYTFADAQNIPTEEKKRQGSLTLYIVDDYGLPTLLPSGRRGPHSVTDSAVRCVLHEFDLSKYTPLKVADRTDTFYVPFDEPVVVPRDCEERGPIWSENVNVLAKKKNKTPLEFLNTYRLMRSRLMAAYDVAGTVTYVSQKNSEATTACNPNPLDMFYNQTLETHDRVAYYQQRSVPLSFRFTASDASASAPATPQGERLSNGGIHVRGATKTTLGVTELRPKKIEFKFKSASKVRQFFRADVDWFMSGDDRDFWKTQGLTGSVRAKMDLSLVPVNADNTPRYSEALPLGPSPLLTSTPEGETQAMRFEITKYVKEKFLEPGSPYFATESGTPYLLRSCISLVTPLPQPLGEVAIDKYNGKTQIVAYAGTNGSLQIAPGEFGQERLEVLQQYTCTTSAMPLVVKLDPSIAPVPADEADQFADSDPQAAGDARVSQTYDQDNDRRCAKAMVAGQKGENCDSRTISGLGGSTAATVLRTEVSNVDKGDKVVADKEAELMGLQVFDEEEEKNFAFMSNKANFTIAIAPSFDSIADAINAANTGGNFEAEEKRFSIGVSGLGLALAIKIPLRYGPVQGEVIFEISAGVGVGAELKFTQERETHLKCADGTNNCDALYTLGTPLPFRQARAACLLLNGGRLADLRVASESTKLRAKLVAGQEYWIGAQVANEYMKGCADLASVQNRVTQTLFTAQCMAAHKTHLRWLSNDEDFATRLASGNYEADLTEIQPGTPALTLRGDSLELPKERGVSLSSTGEMNTPEMTTSLPYVCKAPDSNYAVKNEAEFKIVLAAAAGMKLAFCTPSADMGVCIEGSLNFIEATLEPSITYSHVGVGDSTGGSYISRSNIKLGMEFGLTALNGSVDAKVVFSVGIFDFELKYNIVEFSGFKIPTGDPIEKEFPLTGEPQ